MASTDSQCQVTGDPPVLPPPQPETRAGFPPLVLVPVDSIVGRVLFFSSRTGPRVDSFLAASKEEGRARLAARAGTSPLVPVGSSRAQLPPPSCSPAGGVAAEPPGAGGLAFQPAGAAPTSLLLSLQEAAQWREDVRV